MLLDHSAHDKAEFAFDFDFDFQQATCPQGATSSSWTTCRQQDTEAIVVSWPVSACQHCPVRELCTSGKRRQITIRSRELHEALRDARAKQTTDQWKTRYAARAGVEGTMRQATHVTGIRQARYLGLPKTQLEHNIAAAAINMIRLDAYWTGHPLWTAHDQATSRASTSHTPPDRISQQGHDHVDLRRSPSPANRAAHRTARAAVCPLASSRRRRRTGREVGLPVCIIGMLPPVLEIYVVWHPEDDIGHQIGTQLREHFHGSAYTGLIGGAVEVYTRSAQWRAGSSAPRPIPFPETPSVNGVQPARYVAVLPVLRPRLQRAVQFGEADWRAYIEGLVAAYDRDPDRVGIYPVGVHPNVGGRLGELIDKRFQRVDTVRDDPGDSAQRCTDLAQTLAQKLGGEGKRIKVFLSHSRQKTTGDTGGPGALTRDVRAAIGATHLADFFDLVDLQPGDQWRIELRREAAHSAMLVLRTDMYASRPWCQEELRIAKCAGMPIVVVDGLHQGEERGSFLADHLPRVPAYQPGENRLAGIRRALGILVDECLKRALWRRQQEAVRSDDRLNVAWWAPHAPEPLTLLDWLRRRPDRGTGPLLVLHPDPPLGGPEREVLNDLAAMAGVEAGIEILTP